MLSQEQLEEGGRRGGHDEERCHESDGTRDSCRERRRMCQRSPIVTERMTSP